MGVTAVPSAHWQRSGASRLELAGAVMLVFWPVLLGTYVADDLRLLAHNPAVQSGDFGALLVRPMFGAEGGYWRPLTMLTLWLGNTIGGATGVHLLALLLHLANTFAVRALAARFVPGSAAAWVALLFAVHPAQVESVAWCAAINDPLWVACALQAMLAAMRWRDAGARGLPWATAACAFAALCAKEIGGAAIPLALAAVWWVPAAPTAVSRSVKKRAAAALAMAGVLWLAVRALVQHEWIGRVLVGANMPALIGVHELGRAAHLFIAQGALLVWPWPQLLTRSVPQAEGVAAFGFPAALAGCAVLALCLWRRIGLAGRLSIALIVVPLLPVLAYTKVIGIYPVADRYLYLPAAGFALALAKLLRVERFGLAAFVLPLLLAPFTFAATWTWHDSASLIAKSVKNAPDDPMVLAMAGDLALDRAFGGDRSTVPEAEAYYRRAVAAIGTATRGEQDRRTIGTAKLGLAWCTLMQADRSRGSAGAVIAAFRDAVEAAPQNPMAWVGLGGAHLELREFEAAEHAFGEALRVAPDNAQARSGLERARAARAGRR
jgi:hypothetical protein